MDIAGELTGSTSGPSSRRFSWLSCLLVFVFLSACSGLQKNEQPQIISLRPITGSQTLGQSLVARYDGLQAVTVFLSPVQPENQTLVLQVKQHPGAGEAMRSAELVLSNLTEHGYQRFEFEPIGDSNHEYLYLEFSQAGAGEVQFGAAPAQSYLNGSMYENSTPVEAQLAFQLSYQAGYVAKGLLQEFLAWIWGVLLAFLLFTVPGWAAASLLVSNWHFMGWMEKAAVGTGTSLAIYPLFMLWTDLVGLHLGAPYAWLPVLAGTALILWRNRRHLRSRSSLLQHLDFRRRRLSWAGLSLAWLVLLLFATRLWAVRSLEAPMWGDSYQHSLITQLILDNGGLFDSWLPYAQLQSFTYHFGFHSLASAYHWFTALPSHQSVLWFGQVLNVMAVLSLYPLALRMRRSAWSGVAAVLAAGLLTSMPMYYVNWGRYTQLCGLAILPVLAWASWDAVEREQAGWRDYALAALLLAGLGLTHYRVLIFAAGWFLALILVNTVTGGLKKSAIYIFTAGLLAAILIAPWLARIISSEFLNWIATLFPRSLNPAVVARPPENPFAYLPRYTWLLLPVLAGWGLWRRNIGSVLLGLWWLILFAFVNLKLFRLPFTGLDAFTLQISGYIVFALYLGENVAWLAGLGAGERLMGRMRSLPTPARGGLAALLIAASLAATLWAARQRLWDVRPDLHALVSRPDVNAFSWIQENTTSDSKFLVNSFFAFNNTVIVGSDGGWWLPLLGNRMNSTPPINYDFEAGPSADYQQWTNLLVLEIEQKGLDDPGVIRMLQERGIGYVYVGQKQGAVNSPAALLEIEQLVGSANYQEIFHQDRVWVFKLVAD